MSSLARAVSLDGVYPVVSLVYVYNDPACGRVFGLAGPLAGALPRAQLQYECQNEKHDERDYE